MAINPTSGCPQVSLIIPTHNRSLDLSRSLEALSRQTLGKDRFEVIVVADGCRDDTAQVARRFADVFHLQLIEQPNAGPAVARNRGASAASAGLLVFLDDDVEAFPRLLEAHLEAHAHVDGEQVVIGYLPPVLEEQKGFFRIELHGWWERMFQELRQPDRRMRYSDLLSGNFSISKRLFDEAGGFNPDLRCHEDYELGLRLLHRGVIFVYCEAATGYHHERSDLKRALVRKYEEGIADVQLGRLAAEIKPALLMERLTRYALFPSRILRRLAFRMSPFHPERGGDGLARLMVWSLNVAESLGLYRTWQKLVNGQMGYWYWQGVAQALGSLQAADAFLQDLPAPVDRQLELELADGIAHAEDLLDQTRPTSALILYKGKRVCQIPYEAGSERLRGVHLRTILPTRYPVSLLRAMAQDPAFPFPAVREALIARTQAYLEKTPEESLDA